MINVPIDERDGRFTVDGLPSGKYALNVIPSAGPALLSEPVVLEAGKTLLKDFRVNAPKAGAAEVR
ncbi:MAG: hypothetical protein P4L84_04900 [Isosphaeraceae bacterium]|nr:hypothetical protein [Isosphaeraceae bacterium]